MTVPALLRPFHWLIACALLFLLLPLDGMQTANAQPVSAPGFVLEKLVVGDDRLFGTLHSVNFIVVSPDDRLMVGEQGGQISIVNAANGTLTPFGTLEVDYAYERGLLGLAFDPFFSQNGAIYVAYVPRSAPYLRVSRLETEGDNIKPEIEDVLFEVEPNRVISFNIGGALAFGPDGKLYLATGDGGDSFAAQNLWSLRGKILRLNPDGTIPADNPFAGGNRGGNPAVWAWGLRNPTRLSVDRKNRKLFVFDMRDAGQGQVYAVAAKANYGWPNTPPSNSVHAFSIGMPCPATTGLYFDPTATNYPAQYVGRIFYATLCTEWVRTFDPASRQDSLLATLPGSNIGVADMAVSQRGDLYIVPYNERVVYRLRYEPTNKPRIIQQQNQPPLGSGETAIFSCLAAGSPPLTYTWLRNGQPLPDVLSPVLTILNVQKADDGVAFQCVVSNPNGTDRGEAATLQVSDDPPPIVTIDIVGDSNFRAGGRTSFVITARDGQNRPLSDSKISWWVDYRIDGRAHRYTTLKNGSRGEMTFPSVMDARETGYFRIYAQANDESGLRRVEYTDLAPSVGVVQVSVFPPGMPFVLNGRPVVIDPKRGESTFAQVMGVEHIFEARDLYRGRNGKIYRFAGWMVNGQPLPDGGSPRAQIRLGEELNQVWALYRREDLRPETVGVFIGRNRTFYLRNTNTEGRPDRQVAFGLNGDIPFLGDWDGDGVATPGVFRPEITTFFLTNSTANNPDFDQRFAFGLKGDIPVVGDWNGDGKDGIGVFRPSSRTFFLKDTLATGDPEYRVRYGNTDDKPIAGDWDGDGKDEVGVYRPADGRFFLSAPLAEANTNVKAAPSRFHAVKYILLFGDARPNLLPIAGDWAGTGLSGIGLYDPDTGKFNLKLDVRRGDKPDYVFQIGIRGGVPVVGASAPKP